MVTEWAGVTQTGYDGRLGLALRSRILPKRLRDGQRRSSSLNLRQSQGDSVAIPQTIYREARPPPYGENRFPFPTPVPDGQWKTRTSIQKLPSSRSSWTDVAGR